jgi:hypothetical protein
MKTVTIQMEKRGFVSGELELDYLRSCQERLAGIRVDGAAKELLDEMAVRVADARPDLSEYLRAQIERLGEGDEVRHAVRHGVPQIALLREQVMGRLRREEELLLAEIGEAPPEIAVAPAHRLVAGSLGVAAGVTLWSVLWVWGVNAPWSPLAGAAGAMVVHALVLKRMPRRRRRTRQS